MYNKMRHKTEVENECQYDRKLKYIYIYNIEK